MKYMENKYALGETKGEIQRLSVQASFFEPLTKSALLEAGIKKGMNCVDVGCGTGHVTRLIGEMVGKKGKVVGIDLSERYVNYCKQVNKEKHIQFIKGDVIVNDLGLDESFDAVFSRFMFVHLPDKKQALKSMIKLAKKDGVIIIQELDHASDSWLSYPARECVETLRKCYVEIVKQMGGDPLAGRKLYELFIEASLDSNVECNSPCIMMGREPYNVLGWKLAESLKPKLLSLGLMNIREYEGLLKDLKQMAKDPRSFATYARIFTVTGRKR